MRGLVGSCGVLWGRLSTDLQHVCNVGVTGAKGFQQISVRLSVDRSLVLMGSRGGCLWKGANPGGRAPRGQQWLRNRGRNRQPRRPSVLTTLPHTLGPSPAPQHPPPAPGTVRAAASKDRVFTIGRTSCRMLGECRFHSAMYPQCCDCHPWDHGGP